MVQDTDKQSQPGHGEVQTRRWSVSLVWIVPIVAMLIGASLVVRSWMQEGPVISISFHTGEGLVPNKTQVKYRSVVIGEVLSVELAPDRRSVITKVQLSKEAESFARRGAQFWVVRPRIGIGGVSGVDTLLSGNFIGADSGDSKVSEKNFIGLESPPPITYGEKGKRFMLSADDLGSLDIGSSIYYRKIPVGQVVSYALKADGKGVDIGIFVEAPYDAFVTQDTRFWNASGVDVAVDANGLRVNTESMSSILVGGLAFGSPPHAGESAPAADLQVFELFGDRDTALAPPSGRPVYLSLRFDQSTRGLSVGAPVEFLGVEFGKVTSVQLDYDPAKQSFPFMVETVVYPKRLGPIHQKMLQLFHHTPEDEAGTRDMVRTFIERGLRAQARSGNLITGQKYIALDFYPNAAPVAFKDTPQPYSIPTIPSNLERLQEQLQQVVDRISKLPLDRIANNLDGNLRELQSSLKQFNTQTLPGVTSTLAEVRQTLQAANAALASGSPQREQLSETLDDLDRTSRSLRDLSDYLSRHPESLIRGRPKSADPNDLQP